MKEPSVLLLNASFAPLKVINWRKAIELWYLDKVEIVKNYSNLTIKSVNFVIEYPAVIRLKNFINSFKKPKLVTFSRMNVYRRDRFICQFCGIQPGIKNLTLDHVIPKSRGGTTSWTNIVTACLKCNLKKGNNTPEEANMKMLTLPKEPSVHSSNLFRIKNKKVPPEWEMFLFSKIEG